MKCAQAYTNFLQNTTDMLWVYFSVEYHMHNIAWLEYVNNAKLQ